MSSTDSQGYPLRPMGQTQWHNHAKMCTCGCGLLDALCTTPLPEGPARYLTDEEEEREALGEWYLEHLRTRKEARAPLHEPMSPEEEEQLLF